MVGNGCDVSTKKQKERHLFTGKKAQDQQSHTTNVISPLFLLNPKFIRIHMTHHLSIR
eukprot:m.229837 g.229837  ORF g.229837 m.229837 type:complete len:58 (+) comp40050_c0_seq28:963-1136(+)